MRNSSPALIALGKTESTTAVPSPLWGEGGSTQSSRVRGQKVSPAGVTRARALQRNQTDAERRPWNLLRNRSIAGLKLLRQYPVDPFVVDFVCRDRMLVIEVDGSQHGEDADYDDRRTKYLNARGYDVLRFWNSEVLQELDGVGEVILALASGEQTDPSLGWRYSPATLSPKGRGDPTEETGP